MPKYINPHKGLVMVKMANGQTVRLGSHQMIDCDEAQANRLGLIAVDKENNPVKDLPGILPDNPAPSRVVHRSAAMEAAKKAMAAGAAAAVQIKKPPVKAAPEKKGEESKPEPAPEVDEKAADEVAKATAASTSKDNKKGGKKK